MPFGTLREQLIYPFTQEELKDIKDLDYRLGELMEVVGIKYVVSREGGWDSVNEWNDVLSGGEK